MSGLSRHSKFAVAFCRARCKDAIAVLRDDDH
jgi:hypothetical protein